jgi:hypothetical protein
MNSNINNVSVEPIEVQVNTPVESKKPEISQTVQEGSANLTNDTESISDQVENKNFGLTGYDQANGVGLDFQCNVMTSFGDFTYEQLMEAFYATYCGCTLNALTSALFAPPAFNNIGFVGGEMGQQTDSYDGIDVNQIKGTVYENHVIYSKNDINLQLLKKFKYSSEVRTTATGRPQTVYVCRHDDCNKEFLRTCNLLDHVRMHSGIKPNLCEYCGKGFTQKSNLRKHLKVHLAPELEQRKRYSCQECGCKYTERYNYKVSLESIVILSV